MNEITETKEVTESNRIVNRHKARLLQNLEDANCPRIYIDAVISGLNWLRSDLNDYESKGVKTHGNSEINHNR